MDLSANDGLEQREASWPTTLPCCLPLEGTRPVVLSGLPAAVRGGARRRCAATGITMTTVALLGVAALLLALPTPTSPSGFVKGSFHQHAAQPERKCHRGDDGVQKRQESCGTDADVILDAIADSAQGYAFVGLIGNEEPPTPPKRHHNLTWLLVSENQMAAVCTTGEQNHEHNHTKKKSCPAAACPPLPPPGSGPFTQVFTAPGEGLNNLHREYIQGVPGVFVQHPTTDPQREQILAYMMSGQDNLRGMEVYNSWVEQDWDMEVPRDGAKVDALYPEYKSGQCSAWVEEGGRNNTRYDGDGRCSRLMSMHYWDRTLCALKRPIYGLADDDGFVYTGESDEPVYGHAAKDVQTDSASWFRFGVGFSMVEVLDPANITARDVSAAIDAGQFYASTGLLLELDEPDENLTVVTTEGEAVLFAVVGGAGSDDAEAPLLRGFNVTLCMAAGENLTVTNVSTHVILATFPRDGSEIACVFRSAARVPQLVHTSRRRWPTRFGWICQRCPWRRARILSSLVSRRLRAAGTRLWLSIRLMRRSGRSSWGRIRNQMTCSRAGCCASLGGTTGRSSCSRWAQPPLAGPSCTWCATSATQAAESLRRASRWMVSSRELTTWWRSAGRGSSRPSAPGGTVPAVGRSRTHLPATLDRED